LAPRPAAQCRRFRTIRDAGYASYDATTRARTRADWAAAKPEIDQVLAQYEFVLQGARKDAPPQVKEDLREVAANGHYGRVVLGAAGSSAEFADHVTGDLFNGFGALMRVESKLGSACGRGFTFWPADYQEARP